MKLDSIYFDMLRAAPKKKRPQETTQTICQIEGCNKTAPYRAPKPYALQKKAKHPQERWLFFCKEHITIYNKEYNFFAHMSEDEITQFQKNSRLTGERPVWQLGAKGPKASQSYRLKDPFNLFEQSRKSAKAGTRTEARINKPRKPKILARKAKALATLGLEPDCNEKEIKIKFKELIKRYHPDLNGGGRKYEKRLSAVIQSYKELKKGF